MNKATAIHAERLPLGGCAYEMLTANSTISKQLFGRRRVQFWRLIFLALFVPISALAGDSYYDLFIRNYTDTDVDVTIVNEFCSHVDQYPKRTLKSGETTEANFFRSGACRGGDGRIQMEFKTGSGLAQLILWYTADHGVTSLKTPGIPELTVLAETQMSYSGDIDRIDARIFNLQKIGYESAMKAGCMSTAQLNDLVRPLKNEKQMGSKAQSLLESYSASSLVSKLCVTKSLWGFRSTEREKEISAMKEGKTRSYYDIEYDEADDQYAFVSRNGRPLDREKWQTTGRVDLLALAFRLLAISRSREPMSQFTSVGFDFLTASTQATGNAYVYAFIYTPYSPLLGIKECKTNPGGELQFQVRNGTALGYLKRRDAMGRRSWEDWNTRTQTWVISDDPEPPLNKGTIEGPTSP